MTARLKKFASTLFYLSKCDNATCKAIIKSSKQQLINCISDICHNILSNKVNLSSNEKIKLKKYKKEIRKVSGKKASLKTKKILIQKGGFLGTILAPLIGSVILSLMRGILGNKS